MVSVDDFKQRCISDTAETIVDDIILADDAAHVSEANRNFIISALASTFQVDRDNIYLRIVGSAKLGFSISEKRHRNGRNLQRYRSFSPISDIDVAIVSPDLFRTIWNDLSIYSHNQPWFPWRYKKLGDYMVSGWLRPDHFPDRVRRCDDWRDQFRRFSADPRFQRRTVRGGLYHSLSDLRRYMKRSVSECVRIELEET